jgi:phosphatidylserine/phosphatidylglycerophosphate/cardiolipin synthase-like enzyme
VQLIIQPDDGITPLLKAVRGAKRSIDIVIFRFDRTELARALSDAVARGVPVRALIAHTNRGGEKRLRKLELKLLAAGITVSRTADDLPRYHGKMMIVDGRLFVLGFNYTRQDIEESRSFGIVTRDKRLVKEALALFEADNNRTDYEPGYDRLVVSPETSRPLLSAFIKRAKKQLLIYDEKVTDNAMQRLLRERVNAGVEVRIIGEMEKSLDGVAARRMPGLRLHVRAMVRDGSDVFVGSQSLRKLELDGRREVGVIVHSRGVARLLRAIFEMDWAKAKGSPKRQSRAAKLLKALRGTKAVKAAEAAS